jgi:hypothetical protein
MGDALPYSNGFLVTGNYVVGGVDLNEEIHPITNGFSTGTIPMGDVVPPNADIVAAYLLWETITLTSDASQAAGVKFRGFDIDITNPVTVKASAAPLQGSTAPCWSSGVPLSMRMFRADVLRFLPMQVDKNDKPTGKRLVNDSDLAARGLPPHTVTLPVRTGNEIPESAGASLFVVYRDSTQPLRKIVMYDGIFIKPALNVDMVQSLQGFYRSSADKSAQITHIVASGQPNMNDRISFNNELLATNPFVAGSASQRAWANPTYDVTSLMNPGSSSGLYGETVTTKVHHQPGTGGNDCLTWGAVVFSTAVADVDHDGLPDGLEDAFGVLKDPDDTELPNLKAMGAGSDQRDIFIEANAMRADPGTSYGSPEAPFSSTQVTRTDSVGHHHLPTPEVLKMVGDVYAAKGIRPHFDVGNVADYHSLGVVPHTDWVDDYTSTEADHYLVGNGVGSNATTLATGGEFVKERACNPLTPGCQFPAYPGTVSWKLGLQVIRDQPVGDGGQEISSDPADANYFDWSAGTQRKRFDPARGDLFHYVLYAHARGRAKSLPCLVSGHPAPYDVSGTSCTTNNPDFEPLQYHAPSSTSGIADLPGGDVLITLGLWDEFVGRPFVRASTTLHELGHNAGLWHGGAPPIWGSKPLNTATYFEPNCKPNHLSSMSYLFQVHGLFDDDDNMRLDYSGTAYLGLDEAALTEGSLLPAFPPPAYRPAWFAPAGSALATMLGVPTATRFCNGGKFDPAAPPNPMMARVVSESAVAPVDWNGNGIIDPDWISQDVNFDGVQTSAPKLLNGFDDWSSIRLDQTGAAARGLLAGSAEGLDLEFFQGLDLEFFQGLDLEFFQGLDLEFFQGLDLEFFQGLDLEFFQGLDLEFFQGLDLEFFQGREEMSYNLALELGKSRPSSLAVCNVGTPGCRDAAPFTPAYHRVFGRFSPIPFGAGTYQVQRKRGGAADSTFVTVVTTTTNEFIDYTELADGVTYTYRVRLVAADGNSGWSASRSIPAINDAPMASSDVYEIDNKSELTVAAPGVLGNDADRDSPAAFIGRRAVLDVGPVVGTLTLNANGSFKYTPPKGASFVGPVTFTYRADDGLSSDSPQVPLSGFSAPATVTINVTKK